MEYNWIYTARDIQTGRSCFLFFLLSHYGLEPFLDCTSWPGWRDGGEDLVLARPCADSSLSFFNCLIILQNSDITFSWKLFQASGLSQVHFLCLPLIPRLVSTAVWCSPHWTVGLHSSMTLYPQKLAQGQARVRWSINVWWLQRRKELNLSLY